jgi:hypothetical protein
MAGDEVEIPDSPLPVSSRVRGGASRVCGRCGYSVGGIGAWALCPECGAGPEERREIGAGRVRHWFIILPLAAAMLLTVMPAMFASGRFTLLGVFLCLAFGCGPYFVCYVVIVLVNKPSKRAHALALAVPPALLISLTMGWVFWSSFFEAAKNQSFGAQPGLVLMFAPCPALALTPVAWGLGYFVWWMMFGRGRR